MPMPKVKPTGPLADIVGSKKMLRTEVVAKLWKYIDKKGLKAPGKPGAGKIRVNNRMVYHGQVINSGEDDLFKEYAGGKNKITMFDIGGLNEGWYE
tara:strand:- start:898 stop:1185 length:288 start_codon:yes stop_codon:yes gene_type:complete